MLSNTREEFRDHVSSISKEGKRIWIYPRKPSGRYTRLRTYFSWLLLVLMFGLPFVHIDDRPLILLNVVERKFILFGLVFWPQDLHIFALLFLSLIVFIVAFTAVFGRVWCGWACPQTVFMEMVFRKIEYWIEGDAPRQRALDAEPWTGSKTFKKSVKHIIFFGLSFLIGNTLLAYIIGVEELRHIVTDSPAHHLVGLTFMIGFSLLFYGVFARFRENACIYVCPYGRLQSVLLDRNSIVVIYDHKRGEPRLPIRKGHAQSGAGDCIDCKMCVHVCPTGIDIRNGTQMECVNCTACMDACDTVMEKIGRPKKLIRYASENSISLGRKIKWTPRSIGYTALLGGLIVLSTILISQRSDIEATVLRAKGVLYQVLPDGKISNLYTANIVNKTFDPLDMVIRVKDLPGEIRLAGRDRLLLGPDELTELTFFVDLPRRAINKTHTRIQLEFVADGRVVETIETAFIAPTVK